MRYSFPLFTAAAAVVAAMVRQVIDAQVFNPSDDAVVVPEISAKLVAQYSQAGASDQEIADRFLVEVQLVQQRFGHVLKSNRALRSIYLRGMQLEVAKKHNSPMLIWLGRNELGQSNSPSKPGESMPGIDDPSSE